MAAVNARAALLEDYRVARHADETAREASDCGYATERAQRKADGYERQPITFKEWLRQTAPGAPETAQVQQVCITLVQDAHQRVQDASEAYQQACSIRDMELADAAASGLSYRELGRLIGTSQTIVGKCIGRHNQQRSNRP